MKMLKIEYLNGKESIVAIMPYKGISNKFSYVNLIKGHICNCVFESEYEALKDLEKYDNIKKVEVI